MRCRLRVVRTVVLAHIPAPLRASIPTPTCRARVPRTRTLTDICPDLCVRPTTVADPPPLPSRAPRIQRHIQRRVHEVQGPLRRTLARVPVPWAQRYAEEGVRVDG
jgi:hypothetical protein